MSRLSALVARGLNPAASGHVKALTFSWVFLVVLACGSHLSWGAERFNFSSRMKGIGAPDVCSRLVGGRYVGAQERLSSAYGRPLSLDPELPDFLRFLDFRTAGFSIQRVRDAYQVGHVDPLRDVGVDFSLIASYLRSLVPSLPENSRARFREVAVQLQRQAQEIAAFLERWKIAGRMDDLEKAAETAISDLSRLRGMSGEWQVYFRSSPRVQSSFTLADLWKPKALIDSVFIQEFIGFVAPAGSGSAKKMRELLDDFIRRETPHNNGFRISREEMAARILEKEFDLRRTLAYHREVWLEVKNYESRLSLSELRESDLRKKLEKQIRLSQYVREAMRLLNPSTAIRLELHFLGGITEEAARFLRSRLGEDSAVMSVE